MNEEQSDYYRDQSTIDAARAKLEWVTRLSRGSGRLLDIGANFGYFARDAATRFEALGIEPSALTVAWGRQHLNAPVEVGSIYDARPEFAGRFDVITLFDVIEHLPEPHDALGRIREWLAPGGRLFLTTPDAGSLIARLLGKNWWYIDLTEHIHCSAATTDADDRTEGFTCSHRTSPQLKLCHPAVSATGRHASAAPAHMATQPLRLPGDLNVMQPRRPDG